MKKRKSLGIKQRRSRINQAIVMLVLCITFVMYGFGNELQLVQANEKTGILTKNVESMVCGTTAKIKLPYGYFNPKFKSSNRKVATVTNKGIVKAVRLGVAKITVSSGKRNCSYTITVKPLKSNEVWLNQQAVFLNQKVQLKLESEKYDTSQVSLKFESAYPQISKTGKCKGVSEIGYGSVDYSYGTFKKSTLLAVYSKNEIIRAIFGDEWNPGDHCFIIDAGVEYPVRVESMIKDKLVKPSVLRKEGISLLLDGNTMPDTLNLTPGTHTITIAAGDQKYTENFSVSYSMNEIFKRRDATGWNSECKEVLDAAFQAVASVIKDGMTDEEKVKAIHDYLIYNANYVNNGDYRSAEDWAFDASGVLVHHAGVCDSYALAFYIMAEIAGVESEYIIGRVSTDDVNNHAWNRVKLNGKWYYLDCTWDDPVGGGAERYKYYLSENGWDDHRPGKPMKIVNNSKYEWNMYLIGE